MIGSLSVFQTGQGVVNGDQLNTFVQGGALLANLQATTGLSGMTVYMLGFTAPGDGGQGTFYWNATAGPTGDNETVIVPYGALQGAWVRVSWDNLESLKYVYETPTTGFSIAWTPPTQAISLAPTGTLAAGTIVFPAGPVDGYRIAIASTRQITSLTFSGVGVGGSGLFPAGTNNAYLWNANTSGWILGG